MFFIGHQHIRDRFRKILVNPRNVKRTFLFYGPKHSGKYTLARLFAEQYIFGDPSSENENDVHKSHKESLGDIVEIRPLLEERKGILRIVSVTLEEIREHIREITLSSQHSGKRALLFDDADLLTLSTQNALLKTLEEPVGDTFILLVAHTTDTLLPTLVSRCERIRFGPIARSEFFSLFPQESQDQKKIFWNIALGLPGLGIQMKNDTENFQKRLALWKEGVEIDHMGIIERMRLGERLSKNVSKAIEALELWAFLFREQGLSGSKDIYKSFLQVEKMIDCSRLLKRTQVNARLILENTLLNL